MEQEIGENIITKKGHKWKLISRLRRDFAATKLRESLPTEAIDLLQGRINRSVFLRYYYKPFLRDIRTKTLKGTKPSQKELLEILS